MIFEVDLIVAVHQIVYILFWNDFILLPEEPLMNPNSFFWLHYMLTPLKSHAVACPILRDMFDVAISIKLKKWNYKMISRIAVILYWIEKNLQRYCKYLIPLIILIHTVLNSDIVATNMATTSFNEIIGPYDNLFWLGPVCFKIFRWNPCSFSIFNR